MKKVKSLLLLFMFSFLLTGCIKFNANMDIKKDKSMDFSIIYAMDTSIFGDADIVDKDSKSELEKQGYKVENYTEDKLKGVKLTRSIKNIDEVSKKDATEYSLSGIMQEEKDTPIFQVKKGIFKNTYIAKFDFSQEDSSVTSDDEEYESDTEDEQDYNIDEQETTDEDTDIEWNYEENDEEDFSDSFDFSDSAANMDLSFNVKLPYSAKSNNATKTSNDNKDLSWTLAATGSSTIEFEFALYNMTNIYITVGIVLAVIVVIVAIIVCMKKKNKTQITEVKEV
ncbi:MAG: hypothetical protein IJ574_01220 [Bacilli bacterium]|nr:hypothetical protein [Bacilli bacterium]